MNIVSKKDRQKLRTPREWTSYTVESPFALGLEILPWCLFSTQFFFSRETKKLEFFGYEFGQTDVRSDMQLANMLPNPQSFLIQSIQIYGIASDLALGKFYLRIGAKEYQHRPAWLASVRPKWELNPHGMIAPLQLFMASLTWEYPVELGLGLSGKPIRAKPIQVAMCGQLARPVQ